MARCTICPGDPYVGGGDTRTAAVEGLRAHRAVVHVQAEIGIIEWRGPGMIGPPWIKIDPVFADA